MKHLFTGIMIWKAVPAFRIVRKSFAGMREDTLQQGWVCEDGRNEWRNVPIVDEEGKEIA